MYVVSRIVGVLFVLLAGFVAFQALSLLNLQQVVYSSQLHQPLPDNLRIIGGIAAAVFAIGFLGAGVRFALKPFRLDQNVS